jgi:hypothetical protein
MKKKFFNNAATFWRNCTAKINANSNCTLDDLTFYPLPIPSLFLRLPHVHLQSVMFDFIAKNATAHKVNSYCTLAISYCTFCVGKHTILGPAHKTGDIFRKNQPIPKFFHHEIV